MPREKVPVNVAMHRVQDQGVVVVPHVGYTTATPGLVIVRALCWDREAKEFKVDAARRWQIIHQESGSMVGKDFRSLKSAEATSERLKSLGDWTLSAAEVLKAISVTEVREVLYGTQ